MASQSERAMKPLFVVGVIALSLSCSGCVSHLAAKGLRGSKTLLISPTAAPAPEPDPIRAGGFGADDTKIPTLELVTPKTGTSGVNLHSDIESNTPDGGRSADTGAASRAKMAGLLATEGADAPGAVTDEALAGKGTAAAPNETGNTKADGALGTNSIADPGSRPKGPDNAINGSDPDLIRRPPSADPNLNRE